MIRPAIASLALLAACANHQPGSTVGNDAGGHETRVVAIQGMIDRDEEGMRLTGTCASACIGYLSLRGTCMTPEARLGFHRPASMLDGSILPPPHQQRLEGRYIATLPEAVRAFYMREVFPNRSGWKYTYVSAAEAVEWGWTEYCQ